MKKNEENNKKQKNNRSFIINTILVLLIILVFLATIFVAFKKEIIQTEIPDFDTNAVITSELKNMPELASMEHSKGYIVSAMPAITVNHETGDATLFFTLPETDNVYAKCEIYVSNDILPNPVKTGIGSFFSRFFSRENQAIVDKDGFVKIGETGLIKPGETIKTIHLNQIPIRSTDVRIRYISYVPDTYISGGNFAQITKIYVVDDAGKILDENGNWIEATIKSAKR